MIWIYILAFVALICSINALVKRNSKPNAISITLSSVALIAAFAALAIASPRNLTLSTLNVDYLGVIVAIIAAFATLLLAMQLYNVFSMKEDAKQIAEAKDVIIEYAQQVSDLEEKIKGLEEKISNIDEEISPLYNSIMELQEKAKNALYIDPFDGPDDDK